MKKIIIKNTIALFIGLTVFFAANQFIFHKEFNISVLMSLLTVVGLFSYNDLRKLGNRNTKAFNGVSMLNNGEAFVFENMIIRKIEGKYIVHYQILWEEGETDNNNKSEFYLKELKSDFKKLLSSNRKLNSYLKDQLIEYSIVNNPCG